MRWSHAMGIVAVVASVSGVEAAAAQPADLAARAEAIVSAAYPADGPGAAVIVTQGGRTVYAGGRGLADLDARRPITPDTVFRLGSISKQFTAAMILQLVQEGRLSLDDPISRFFPEYPQPSASATVRQLLNQTSGIADRGDLQGITVEAITNRPYTTAERIALFRDRPAPAAPGQAWAYNNSNYVMLGAIIEAVTGRPWHQVLEERITGPLGLTSIGYGVDRETRPGMARGYTEDDGAARPAMRIHMSVPHGAGALVGTVGDLARWNQALHGGRVVSAELYRAMTSPAPLPDGRTHPYGFGLALDETNGRPTIGHGGAIFGFRTDSLYVPSEDLFVAVLANNEEPATSPPVVAARLVALALGEPVREFTRADVPPQSLAPLLGVYRIGDGEATRRFYAREGRLFTMREGSAEMEAFAARRRPFLLRAQQPRLVPDRAPRRRESRHGDAPARGAAGRARGAHRRRAGAGRRRSGDAAILCGPLRERGADGDDRDEGGWRTDAPARRRAGAADPPGEPDGIPARGLRRPDHFPSGRRRGEPPRHPPGRTSARSAPGTLKARGSAAARAGGRTTEP